MPNVYISSVKSDAYFVKLLNALLEFHYLKCHLLKETDKGIKKAQDIIEIADSFIAVISRNSLTSELIKRDIEIFQRSRLGNSVMLIMLDAIDVNELNIKLENYYAIHFYQCYLTGFKKLMSHFNLEFLPSSDKRSNAERRSSKDQRTGDDRRVSNLVHRLRTGFWKSYSIATGAGVYDYIMMESVQQVLVTEFLSPEAMNYSYVDLQDRNVDADEVLEKSINEIWERYEKGSFKRAISVIEAIADYIYENYSVEAIDRRKDPDRREGDERRKYSLNFNYLDSHVSG